MLTWLSLLQFLALITIIKCDEPTPTPPTGPGMFLMSFPKVKSLNVNNYLFI